MRTIWTREDLMLLYVQIDHRRWVEEVRQMVEGSSEIVLEPDPETGECRFGKWYYHSGKNRYSHLGGFIEIEPIHDRLHASSRRIFKRLSEGNVTLARVEFQRLLGISELLHDKLDHLARQVTEKRAF